MTSKDVSYALATRLRYEPENESKGSDKSSLHREVLLVQRAASESVMPGLWELPNLREEKFPDSELRMKVRHAIMQVNYKVRIRTVIEPEVEQLIAEPPAGSELCWFNLKEAEEMALTGLARKVLKQAKLFSEKD